MQADSIKRISKSIGSQSILSAAAVLLVEKDNSIFVNPKGLI